MSSVTYKNQPGIAKTNGSIPLSGTSHVYTVGRLLWPQSVEAWIAERLVGTTLHVCPGKSQLGDVRVDLFEPDVDVKADAAYLPFAEGSFDTILCDPPYSGKFAWNHRMLDELHRIARYRIIFQHHFSPVDKDGFFKKKHAFMLTDAALVPEMPKNLTGDVTLAVKTDQGYMVVEDVPEDEKTFYLSDLAYWQGRTYFGRVQLISILDRLGYDPPPESTFRQISFPESVYAA